jgi:hypothetical protein
VYEVVVDIVVESSVKFVFVEEVPKENEATFVSIELFTRTSVVVIIFESSFKFVNVVIDKELVLVIDVVVVLGANLQLLSGEILK